MRQLTLTACLLAFLVATSAQITPVNNAAFYPYGPGTADNEGALGQQSLSTSFPFFGNTYASLYVNINGAISFGGAVTGFTSAAFPVTDNKVIAAFFTDIQTNHTGHIYHRETVDADVLARATMDVRTAFPADNGSFVATWTYIATWHEVGMKGATGDGLNLETRSNWCWLRIAASPSSCLTMTRSSSYKGAAAVEMELLVQDRAQHRHPYVALKWTPQGKRSRGRPLGTWRRTVEGEMKAALCPRNRYFRRRGDKCLQFFHTGRTYSYPEAKAVCADEGAELFIIRS
uniref:NIDO domain-containing protein n=1 Tax=Branchiostoma floridae TaxID=7739 RepID=C4A0E5_BRAFL|eukprot:XP_002585720.1 hypothetical protein BRAFLDRAFT_111362 [Branchiostoma floridae]